MDHYNDMFICEHCRREVNVDRTDDAAEILLALTAHQINDCVSTPRWAASMPVIKSAA